MAFLYTFTSAKQGLPEVGQSLEGNLESIQRYTGVAGVAIICTSIAVGMLRANLHLLDPRPISFLGIDPSSALLFKGGLIISALLFISFGYYVKVRFRANNLFMSYLVLGQLIQITAAIVPYGGQFKIVHTIAAFILAFTLPILMWQFTSSQSQSAHARLYRYLLRFEQATFFIGISLFVFTKGIAPIGEALPAMGFYLWIIIITFMTQPLFSQLEKESNSLG